ncbi:hypothetical protein ISF_00204 [Cordyceps fumosorosea ARSEF 2679]|uniref:Uncharacterized protein n=1 Tax=Cordyceps fumosorosea (strain ARSEF 2679) TaxID=1081104 RepID=A0A168E2K6_CORFA|nr:hypothetical protein ISF_00204 [Cordyceps fumosorosea ARSEF 2679]OAA73303.1 hypothetical protein ISF_00204 [Cordyceps fumosorosea ARSEF 2679]
MASVKANSKRHKDDKEHHRKRLTDASFNANRYPNPLEARPSPDPKFKGPEGVTAKMTRNWLDMIKAAKVNSASSQL